MQPDWYTLPDFVIEQFPALREEIEAEYFAYLEHQANPSPHFFLDTFVQPILLGQRPNVTEDDRRRAGDLLERVVDSHDEDLAAAAVTEILEDLVASDALRESAWPYLGPAARGWIERLTS